MGEAEEKGTNAPQGAVKSFVEFLKLLETRQVPKVDKSFLHDHGIASGNEYKFMAGLKFLGLTDNDGKATEDMNSLCVVGEKRKENLAKVVRRAYSLLFDVLKLDLEKADSDTLINAFKTDYKMGSVQTAKQGAQIFVFLAQQAGIPFSQQIQENLSVSLERAKKISEVAKQPREKKLEGKPSQITQKGKQETLPSDVLARFELKGTGYVDIKDKDTYELAKAYMNLLAKKLEIPKEQD
jgi:hypothetical protein